MPTLLLFAPLRMEPHNGPAISGYINWTEQTPGMLISFILIAVLLITVSYLMFLHLLPRFAAYYSTVLPMVRQGFAAPEALPGKPDWIWRAVYGGGEELNRSDNTCKGLVQRYVAACYVMGVAPAIPQLAQAAFGLGCSAVVLLIASAAGILYPLLDSVAGDGSMPPGIDWVWHGVPVVLAGLELAILLFIPAVTIRSAQFHALFTALAQDRGLQGYIRHQLLQMP